MIALKYWSKGNMIFSQLYDDCVYNMFMICYVLLPLCIEMVILSFMWLLSQDLSASDHEMNFFFFFLDFLALALIYKEVSQTWCTLLPPPRSTILSILHLPSLQCTLRIPEDTGSTKKQLQVQLLTTPFLMIPNLCTAHQGWHTLTHPGILSSLTYANKGYFLLCTSDATWHGSYYSMPWYEH